MEAATPFFLQGSTPLVLSLLIVILLGAFVAWLALFVLDLLLDTSRPGLQEYRWGLARHLMLGSVLLVAVLILGTIQYVVYYEPYDPPLPSYTGVHAGTEAPVELEEAQPDATAEGDAIERP